MKNPAESAGFFIRTINHFLLASQLIYNIFEHTIEIMFVAPLKDKVVEPYSTNFTQEFLDWASSTLEDKYEIVMERNGKESDYAKLIFSSENDMTLYLLTWTEEVTYPKSVILPIIRRVMPTVIANEILGVQPMTGPVGSIFSLKSRYL